VGSAALEVQFRHHVSGTLLMVGGCYADHVVGTGGAPLPLSHGKMAIAFNPPNAVQVVNLTTAASSVTMDVHRPRQDLVLDNSGLNSELLSRFL
jgi:hypothetical protein